MFEFIGHTVLPSHQKRFQWFPVLCQYFENTAALSRFAGRLSVMLPRATFDVSHFWVLRGSYVVFVRESFWKRHTFSWADLKNHV